MGKSFKSVITVFRDYPDARTVHTFSGGFQRRLGRGAGPKGKGRVFGWLPKKIQTPHKHLSRHGYGSRYLYFLSSLQPLHFPPANSFIGAKSFVGSSSANACVASVHVISAQSAGGGRRSIKRITWHENELHLNEMWMKRKSNANISLSESAWSD